MAEKWISREEAEQLNIGSVIMLGGYLAIQKDAEADGSDPMWSAAGSQVPMRLERIPDKAFPALLAFEADESWMRRANKALGREGL